VERYTFDARWRYAAGVGGYDAGGWGSFAHTVLVDMRERLRRSEDRDRIFRVAFETAEAAGLVGRKRVLDSTPLYDAVATMDTVTLIRSGIRGLLRVADADLAAVLTSGDDYASSAKPQIDWSDASAREALIDSRAKDGFACLGVLDGRELSDEVRQAGELLAKVLGQDLEEGTDGTFRIARKVAKDRVISTVDPEARHGHKTVHRSFDGYKGHVAVDPDSEIITDATVTPGNAGDASVAADLVDDLLSDGTTGAEAAGKPTADPQCHEPPTVYGDNAYGTGEFQSRLEDAGIDSRVKTQVPTASGGLFSKDRFDVDVIGGTVTCPAGVTVAIRRHTDRGGRAYFGEACITCPLRTRCTTSVTGRGVDVNPHETALSRARGRQEDPDWAADYRATRPKVERKLAHLVRRRHGGRRARVRGTSKVTADFRLLAGATNLARLAVLGLRSSTGGWVVHTG
jgi:hypothetical protein